MILNKDQSADRRTFPVQIDETKAEFRQPTVVGKELLDKVGKCPCRYALVQVIKGKDDQFIDPDEKVDLSQPGVERFVTVQKDEVQIFVHHGPARIDLTVPRGPLSVQKLKSLAGLPTEGYLVFDHSTGTPLPENGTIKIEGCEVYDTQVCGGAAS